MATSQKDQETTVLMPDYQLYESPNSRSIKLGPWTITASTNPISSAHECELLQATVGIPIPEMTFGRNFLKLEHHPDAWIYTFSTEGALKAVKVGELEDGDGGVKVGYAEKWLQSRRVYLFLHARLTMILTEWIHRLTTQCLRLSQQNRTTGHIRPRIQDTR